MILDEGIVSCQVFSSSIIGEHLELLNWQMVSKIRFQNLINKRMPLIVANVYQRKTFISQ